MKNSRIQLFLILLTLVTANLQSLLAQGTTFTYQGYLTDAGAGANGIYDLRFSLFDVDSGGVAVAGPLTTNGVAVSNGLFTVTIDFGSSQFDGDKLWLEIGVQTNGGGGFSTLSPRTQITPAPYAIFSGTAGGVPNNTIGSAQVIDNSLTATDLAANSVGASEIAASAVGTSEIADGSVASVDIANGGVSRVDLNADARYSLDAQDGTPTDVVLVDNSGLVGIGNPTPLYQLDVDAGANLTMRLAADSNPLMTFYEGATYRAFLQPFGDDLYLANRSTGRMLFRTANLDRMLIDADGRVGIGTQTPSDTLHIFNSGNEGDIMVENNFPFITLNQNGTNGNAGFLFTDQIGNSAWLYYRGSDQALSMGSTAGFVTPDTLVLQRDGNVGIGTATAFTRLTVNGTIGFESPSTPAMYIYETGSANVVKPLFVHSPSFPTWGLFYDDSTDEFVIGSTTTNDPALVVSAGGDWVAINTSTPKPGYELSVDGQIVCEELLVENSVDWPDYVFKEDYLLRPLAEVEAHIKERKHLPGIPTAEEVKRDGLPIGEMQKRMMEKIEELTLYVIDQNKRLATQEQKILELQVQLQASQP